MSKLSIANALAAATPPQPVVLIVLDGWGAALPSEGNAIAAAAKPFFTDLVGRYPVLTLAASGEDVGLPAKVFGNSEVGHLNLGAGRVVFNDLQRINQAIADQTFFSNKTLHAAVRHTKENGGALHLCGLVSGGQVHSAFNHLLAMLEFAKQQKVAKVLVHVFLDGRDALSNSGAGFVKDLEKQMTKIGVGRIATICGRFYAMDRDNHWERTSKAYLAMTAGVGHKVKSADQAIALSYERGVYDEEFEPAIIFGDDRQPLGLVGDGDAVISFNFRPDRIRQLTKAFVAPDLPQWPERVLVNNLFFATMTEYETGLPAAVVFPPLVVEQTLGDIVAEHHLRQLRLAETEKYAHVTYFFNGGREAAASGEDRVLIPSPRLPSYAAAPAMSAREITERAVAEITAEKYQFILINFANADMVGHTGDFAATVEAVTVLDECLKKIVTAVLAGGGLVVITADHGKADMMTDLKTGSILKEHSLSPVPLILVSPELEGLSFGEDAPDGDLSLLKPSGRLADVAPTILKIMRLEQPAVMTGRSLF